MVNDMVSGDVEGKWYLAAEVLNVSKDSEDTMIVETPSCYLILEPKGNK